MSAITETAAPVPALLPAGMVATIAGKEFTELLRDARLKWAGGLIAVLMLTALLLGWQQQQQLDRERAAASHTSYQQWLGQGEKNPHSAAHYGQYAFKPASPLSFLDPGINPYVGSAVWMEAHKQNEFRFRPARDATSLRRFGDLSINFVWQVLSPLLIVLITFNAFTGERERGTLRQLLSVGVQPAQLLVGKMTAISALLAILLVPPMLMAMAMLFFVDEHHVDSLDILGRSGLMFIGYAVYLAGFALLSLGVSAACGSSRKALIVLLAFWVLNCFVAPRAITDVAARLAPTPSAVQFQSALTQAKKANFGHDEKHPAFIAFRDSVLARYGVSRVEDLPVNFRALSLNEDDERGYRIYDEHYGRLWAIYLEQERIRSLAGVLFPMAALQPWSMAMAGTDIAQQNDFATAAERYRREIQKAMAADMIRNRPNDGSDYVAGPELWASIAPFEYRLPQAASVLGNQWRNLLLLLVWAVMIGGFALTVVRRLRPT
ncbi:DUF3526 domain-containing protein [Nevskia sp.]|uniref:ABC transporter permease n=1 Tax=Nevskia sp. TaxID=1929292 RepID=UPI0025EB557F|nr:DUF3526 domain-containing protein [Nevskia sp.]